MKSTNSSVASIPALNAKKYNAELPAETRKIKKVVDGNRFIFFQEPMASLPASEQALFEKFSQGRRCPLPFQCIHYAFEKMAKDSQDTIAANHLGEVITYSELNQQANKLARHLSESGVTVGSNVGVFLKRSIPMLISMIAVLKVGACYVPQDVGVVPEAQLRHIIKVAEIDVILTLSKFKHTTQNLGAMSCIAVDEYSFDQKHTETKHFLAKNAIGQHDSCFILFTSGTTGKPNGVKITHANLCNIVLTHPGSLGITPGVKVSQLLNISFDMAAWEVWSCLAHGGTLIIRGDDISAAVENADVVIATPSILGSVDPRRCQHVKVAAVAGEPCPRPLAESWSSFCTFYNSCGPTETTIVNTMGRYTPGSNRLTIGKPTPNNTVYILDENLMPCRIGDVGEMWAGGDCVSAGYLDNHALNQERYLPDPFLGNGRTMFRTRDLARWTQNGELEVFGRTDDQVKVSGFRVELDSISTVLETVKYCTKAVTLQCDDGRLVAFVAPACVNLEEAKNALQQKLPYYCMPSEILILNDMPKTDRGKIDKKALLNRVETTQ